MKKIKCPNCGSELYLQLGYDGCDWDTVAGDGSGYDFPLSLCCHNNQCACIFTLGRLRNEFAFSESIEEYRSYAGRLND